MTRHEGSTTRQVPTRIYMKVRGLGPADAHAAARSAVVVARQLCPRVSGESAASFRPIWGPGYFGITWQGDHIWYQEMGIRPFTMHRLAGKVIPMWINDPSGKEQQANPKARTRLTQDGRRQVLIFRRAANPGQRKMVTRRVGSNEVQVSVPMSFPGAPGRIARREPAAPDTPLGRLGGQVARGNVGVRWRHPGTFARFFLREGLLQAAYTHGLEPGAIMYASDGIQARRQSSIGRGRPSAIVRGR